MKPIKGIKDTKFNRKLIPKKYIKQGNIIFSLSNRNLSEEDNREESYFFRIIGVNEDIIEYDTYHTNPKYDRKNEECVCSYDEDEFLFLCSEEELAVFLLTRETDTPIFPKVDK